jgi:hypothetical protein
MVERLTAPRSIMSSRRPGVATTTAGRAFSSANWRDMLAPPIKFAQRFCFAGFRSR